MQAKNLIVLGSSRLLGKLYCNDLSVGSSATFLGDLSTEGTLNIGANTSSNAIIKLNGKEALKGIDSWLRINASNGFTNGIYFGSSLVRTDGVLRVGSSATTFNITTSQATIGIPTIINSSLVANSLQSTTINNTGNIYNSYGTIETDTIKSNKWDIVSTQNLGGNFYVCPTIVVTENSTVTITAVSGNTITGTLEDTQNIQSDSFAGHTWTKDSKIKITGKLTSGSTSYVLGTCDGTLKANMNTQANTLSFEVQCNALTIPSPGTYTISGGTVMMYNIGGTNPVGIYMTCYGTDKYTYIDIYNGSNGVKPVARLGKLDNLKDGNGNALTINGKSFSNAGYGLYTNNGFFEGTIVANGGKIGGYTIGTSNLTKGDTRNASGSFWLTPEGQSVAMSSLSSTALIWAMTVGQNFGVTTAGGVYAASGKIGGWSIGQDSLYSGSHSTYNYAGDGIFLGKSSNEYYIAGGSGAEWWLKSDGSAKIGAMTLSAAGVLSVPAANVSGELTAATINGANIIANTITVGKINPNVYSYNNSGRGTGYAKLFTIAHTQSYKNSPISFVFHNRGKKDTRVTFNYLNNGTATSAVVQNATYDGGTPFYYVSKGNAVYDVYFALAESYDTIYISDYINPYSEIGLEVTWSGEYYGTSLPEGAIEFTKLAGSRNSTDIDAAATTATSYITNIDSNNGITIKPKIQTGNDYIQINSNAISFHRNGTETSKFEDSAIRIGKLGTNLRNVYITDSAVQIRNNEAVLAEYGSAITLYQPGAVTQTAVLTIDSNGLSTTGTINATGGSIGGFTIDNTNLTYGNFNQAGSFYLQPSGYQGELTAMSTGTQSWAMTIGTAFGVTTSGKVYANNVELVGSIAANGGSIGGWTIDGTNNKLTNGTYAEFSPTSLYISASPNNAAQKAVILRAETGKEYIVVAGSTNALVMGYLNNVEHNLLPSEIDFGSNWGCFCTTDFGIYSTDDVNIISGGADILLEGLNATLYLGGGAEYTNGGVELTTTEAIACYSDKKITLNGETGISLETPTTVCAVGYNDYLFRPGETNQCLLGTSNYRWKKIYTSSAVDISSDRKLKDNINPINYAKDLIMGLQPIDFQWKNGDHRRHSMGFIAQEVNQLTKKINKNLALVSASYRCIKNEEIPSKEYFGEDVNDEELIWSLAYTELLAPLVQVVQDQQKEIDELKQLLLKR